MWIDRYITHLWRNVFNISMQGRYSCRLDPGSSIQVQKWAVYRALPVLKSSTVFAYFAFDSLFVRRSFLGVRRAKHIKNRILKSLVVSYPLKS